MSQMQARTGGGPSPLLHDCISSCRAAVGSRVGRCKYFGPLRERICLSARLRPGCSAYGC